jgi:hypothetical protein
MAPRTTYASLTDGLSPLSLWDQSLADMGNLGIIPCTAAGTNAVTLTPVAAAFAPNVTAYQANQLFSFTAAANSTGVVTVKVGSLAPLTLVNGTLGSGLFYIVAYNATINGGNPGFVVVGGNSLPVPTPTTLGGVKSAAAVPHQWINSIGTDGAPTQTQPAFSDISGTATGAQLPVPTPTTLGGVKSLASASHQFLNQIGTDGTPSAAQPSTADVAFTQTGSGAAAITEDVLLRNKIFTPEMFGAVSSPLGTAAGSVADSTTAINNAIVAIAVIGGGVLQFGPGVYATTGIAVTSPHIILRGAGKDATTILFKPSSPSTCITMSAGASVLYRCGIEDLSIGSNDTTTVKNAITMVDTSECFVRRVNIAHYPADGTLWRSSTNAAGIQTQGRELGRIEDVAIAAQTPIQISANPNFAGGTEDLDSWVFRNLYLIGELSSATHHLILIDAGPAPFNTRFDGAQNWVGGVDGLHWVDGGSTSSAFGLYLSGVKDEQPGDGTGSGWTFNIQVNNALYGLKIEDCASTGGRGLAKLRKVKTATLDNVVYAPIGTNKAGLDLDSTAQFVELSNCWWNTGTTASITGLVSTQIEPNVSGLSTAIPSRGTYAASGAWTSYTPVLASQAGGALGSGNTATGFYRIVGKTVHVRATITMGASGVGTATQASMTIPTAAVGDAVLVAKNRGSALGGVGDIGTISLSTALLTTAGGGAILLGNSQVVVVSGTYEAA